VNLDVLALASGAPFFTGMSCSAAACDELCVDMLCFVEARKEIILARESFIFETSLSSACRTHVGNLESVRPRTCFYAIVHNGSFLYRAAFGAHKKRRAQRRAFKRAAKCC
jgi:hypothetical protein